MSGERVELPAGYAPMTGIGFGDPGAAVVPVDYDTPLPVMTPGGAASTATPLTGSTSATATVGPFTPQLGRAIWVTLSGSWSGSVQMLRSRDGGTTKLPLTYGDGSAKPSWTSNVNAAVAEETVSGATYYLAITLNSGSVTYRLEQ